MAEIKAVASYDADKDGLEPLLLAGVRRTFAVIRPDEAPDERGHFFLCWFEEKGGKVIDYVTYPNTYPNDKVRMMGYLFDQLNPALVLVDTIGVSSWGRRPLERHEPKDFAYLDGKLIKLA